MNHIDKVWITKTGEKIPITKMGWDHMNNCINCLEGMGKTMINHLSEKQKAEWIEAFKEELERRSPKVYSVF